MALSSVIGHDLLQPRIFFLQLFQLLYLVRFQPHVLLLPPVERLLRHSHYSEQLRQRHSSFGLLQNRHDLLDGESLLLHGKIPLFYALIY
jgi:hypothetical protein